MPPKRKMNTKTQKVAKTISFYMKNFQPSLKSILLFKKLQRERSFFAATQRPEEEQQQEHVCEYIKNEFFLQWKH